MSNIKKRIEKLEKTIKKLQKQLECSEWKRAHLEDIMEKGQILLKTINKEVDEARKLISKQNRKLKKLNKELEIEKRKSDHLLLNILPEKIADELKQNEKVKPILYDSVSVLFTDFSGFTQISEKMTPGTLIKELDYCFSNFDKICGKFNLEKLKTIGDSFMCAGGIPIVNKTHPVDTVMAGLEILEFMRERIKVKKSKRIPYWNIRIGIHTGPLIAGIIGKRKFAYDIWGDSVNIASRMESSGLINKINISKATRDLVNDFFSIKHRGKVEIKNKGKMDMFIIRNLKPKLKSKSSKPNKEFLKLYNILK